MLLQPMRSARSWGRYHAKAGLLDLGVFAPGRLLSPADGCIGALAAFRQGQPCVASGQSRLHRFRCHTAS